MFRNTPPGDFHYDFRLELEGTLKSWAVPKGPSFDPSVRSLAVHVEDHPLEYGKFEGTIPAGEYGGGSVMLWDRGSWEPLGDALKDYKAGNLKFRLAGERLKGEWHLVRMTGKAGENGKNWLLIKTKDPHAIPRDGHARVETFQTSVHTGRTMQEIADHVTHAQNGKSNGARRKPAKPASANFSSIPGARQCKQPTYIKPQLATLTSEIPAGDDWLHELKLDGYRLICVKRADSVHLFTRQGRDWTERFPTVAEAVARLPIEEAIFDGEVVIMASDGTSDFQALQNSLRAKNSDKHVFFVFDLPHCGGYDLTQTPLLRRKDLLASLLSNLPKNGALRYSDHIRGHGADVIAHACRYALEGTVSKHADSPYVSKRSREWLKVKCRKRQEFVVGGWTEPDGARKHFGALLLGWYDGAELRYCGRVGTGFNAASLKTIAADLKKNETTQPAFANPPPRRRSIHWTKPALIAEIEFANWTDDGVLRQASFLGMREDKRASDVTREKAIPMAEARRRTPKKISPTVKSTQAKSFAGVRLTNPDRVLFPNQGITKKDVAEYYTAVADVALPYLTKRPLTVVRCPQGYGGECFFQRHLTASFPRHVFPIPIEEKDGIEQCLSIRDVAGLISLIQINALEIHAWGSRQENVEKPDWIVFDLDPDSFVPWKGVVDAARELREFLERMDLQSFVRTTGGKGLHVVVPIVPKHEWPVVKRFAKDVADRMVRKKPDTYIATASKARRKGKIYIDYLRNERGATAIANYSTRARDGASVAMPIRWNELSSRLKPTAFTVSNVPRRLARLANDPWEDFFSVRQSLPALLED